MKNWQRYLAIAIALCFVVAIVPTKAHADALTIGMVGAAVFAVGTALGISWTMDNMTDGGVSTYIQGKISNWMGGQTITEKFGSEAMKIAAGKLVIPMTLYNGVVSFLNDYKTENETTSGIGTGTVSVTTQNYEYWAGGLEGVEGHDTWIRAVYYKKEISTGTVNKINGGTWQTHNNVVNEGLVVDGNYVNGIYSYTTAGERKSQAVQLGTFQGTAQSVSVDLGTYQEQTPIDVGKQWEGTLTGAPDTNLDQLMNDIYGDVADNNLQVEGEITDVPPVVEPTTPPVEPTTVPTYPPLDDVLGGLGQIEGTLEGVQDAVGSIDQTLEGVGEDVGEIEQTITEALEVPDVEDVELHKFDLKGLFPFCIPFDLHAIISAFSREPVTPSVSVPFNIPMIGLEYTFELDLHDFDGLAQVLRTLEFIAFGVGLLFVTGKVIKW